MVQFDYIDKLGVRKTIEAPDANTALKMLPADADPHSGVQATLSGTGTPSPSEGGLPEQTPMLPDSEPTGNPLLDFKNAIASIDTFLYAHH